MPGVHRQFGKRRFSPFAPSLRWSWLVIVGLFQPFFYQPLIGRMFEDFDLSFSVLFRRRWYCFILHCFKKIISSSGCTLTHVRTCADCADLRSKVKWCAYRENRLFARYATDSVLAALLIGRFSLTGSAHILVMWRNLKIKMGKSVAKINMWNKGIRICIDIISIFILWFCAGMLNREVNLER